MNSCLLETTTLCAAVAPVVLRTWSVTNLRWYDDETATFNSCVTTVSFLLPSFLNATLKGLHGTLKGLHGHKVHEGITAEAAVQLEN